MRIKSGVRIAGIKPELLFGLRVAETVYEVFGFPLIVTAVVDGVHKVGSKHYVGMAADLRISHLGNSIAPQIVAMLKSLIDQDFDIVLESDHIHLEYDPK
jgi:hypothetical protein